MMKPTPAMEKGASSLLYAIFGSAGFAAGDLSQIGPALAVCTLTVFYGYFFKIGAIILEG